MVGETIQETGLVDSRGKKLKTRVFGYADQNDMIATWPGRTFEVDNKDAGGPDEIEVIWENNLGFSHLLPVDTSLHWCYELHGASSANGHDYRQYSIEKNGVPIITHLHGGHSDYQFDGNPEFFYGPEIAKGGRRRRGRKERVVGPQWDSVPEGFTNKFRYDNTVPAGNLWYHDHALGLTRLNVYAGMAGFYFVRDTFDTGEPGNPLGLPAWPYEKAYAIQDRMFTSSGDLFYPAFPGDPFYEGFIVEEEADLSAGFDEYFDAFDNPYGGTETLYGPTALAEFFGDHIVVNGVIWPYEAVEPRQYRLHLLNGTDSRFMGLRFRVVDSGFEDEKIPDNAPVLDFHVIGSDQGLAGKAIHVEDTLVSEPGSRYDVIVDFSDESLIGKRVILENTGGDSPFGGDFSEADYFPDRRTDRIMAFDVVQRLNRRVPATPFSPGGFHDSTRNPTNGNGTDKTRRVALFEGKDEYGRLQPLLGTVADDGSVATAYTWFQDTTETPRYGDTEEWEIYNFTGDAHPVHLHLVHFEETDRQKIRFDVEGTVPTTQHNGESGEVANVVEIHLEGDPDPRDEIYVKTSRRDMVTALPGEMVKVKATFDKRGRYVWHCHILSHEDHEMMRV